MKPAVPLLILVVLGAILWFSLREVSAPPTPVQIGAGENPAVPAPAAVSLSATDEAPARQEIVVETRAAPPAAATPSDDKQALNENEAMLLVRIAAAEDDQPVEGVRVAAAFGSPNESPTQAWTWAQGSFGRRGEAAETDANGRASLVVPAGVDCTLKCFGGEKCAPLDMRVNALEAGERREVWLNVATKDDIRFVGRLVAEESGDPITDAEIDLLRHGWSSLDEDPALAPSGVLLTEHHRSTPPIRPDHDGRFEIHTASWREGTARIVSPGRSLVMLPLPRNGGDTSGEQRIVLARSGRVSVTLTDASGAPAPGVQARLSTHSFLLAPRSNTFEMVDDPAWQATTGMDGRCELRDLPVRVPLRLELIQAGDVLLREEGAATLAPGEGIVLDRRVGSRARIRGRLVDQSGAPVAHQELWLAPSKQNGLRFFMPGMPLTAKTKTDAGGEFEFSEVQEGEYLLGPAAAWWVGRKAVGLERACAPVGQVVHVEGEGIAGLVVQTHRGLTIGGHVLDPSGEPVASLSVYAVLPETGLLAQGETNEKGRFLLGPLVPGRYQVATPAGTGAFAPAESVHAEAGEQEITLRLRSGGTVAGAILARQGQKPVAASVALARLDREEELGFVRTAEASAAGRFLFEGLEPGAYSLAAQTQDGRCGMLTRFTLDAGQLVEGLRVEVEPGARLRLRAEGKEAGAFVAVYCGDVAIMSDQIAPGSTAEQTVPGGKVRILTFVRDGPPHEQTVELGVGETREVLVRPPVK